MVLGVCGGRGVDRNLGNLNECLLYRVDKETNIWVGYASFSSFQRFDECRGREGNTVLNSSEPSQSFILLYLSSNFSSSS